MYTVDVFRVYVLILALYIQVLFFGHVRCRYYSSRSLIGWKSFKLRVSKQDMLVPIWKVLCLAQALRASVAAESTNGASSQAVSSIVIMASDNKTVIVPAKRANADYPVRQVPPANLSRVELRLLIIVSVLAAH